MTLAAVALSAWCQIQRGALFLTRRLVVHPVRCLVAAVIVWLAFPLFWLIAMGLGFAALVATSLCGSEARAHASTLLKTVRFSYRRSRIKRKWRRVMLNAELSQIERTEMGDLKHGASHRVVPKLMVRKITPVPMGLVAVADGRKTGHGVDAFGTKLNMICTGMGCRSATLRQDPEAPWLAQLRLLYDDPFRNIIRASDLPSASSKDKYVVGFDEDGEAVEKGYWLSQLIVGAPGAGKSSEGWRKLQALVEHKVPFRLRIYDPKGEFFNLEDKAYYYAQNNFVKFLQDAMYALEARKSALRGLGFREVSTNDPGFPLADFPLDFMLIDEFINALVSVDNKPVIRWEGDKLAPKDAMLVYLSQLRSLNAIVDAYTQVPQKEIIGLSRDTFGYKSLMRVGSAEAVRIVFPVEDAAKQYPAHMIPPDKAHAGIAFTDIDGEIIKYRGAYLTDIERDVVAAAIRKLSETYWDATVHDKGRE